MFIRLARKALGYTRTSSMSSYPSIPSIEQNMNATKNIAILRSLEDGEKITFSFRLTTKRFGGIDKQFNMCRNVNEDLSEFVKRLSSNVEKVVNKKAKNKKLKTLGSKDESPELTCHHDMPITFCQNREPITDPNSKVKDVLFDSTTELNVGEEVFKIDINPPMVENATLNSKIMSGFMTYPYKLKLERANKVDSKFEWFVSEKMFPTKVNESHDAKITSNENKTNKITKGQLDIDTKSLKWIKRADEFFFIPSTEDIDRYVKLVCHPMLKDRTGVAFEVISKNTISEGPSFCPFEARHASKPEVLESEFRIVSYNLLADLYADSDFSRTVLFSQCPPSALAIDYRKQLLLKEIRGYNADIICLQEVDNKIFDLDLLPVLSEKDDLNGVFNRKGGQVSEGLACFWRTTKFKKLDSWSFILSDSLQSESQFESMWKVVKCNERLKESMLGRTTAIQIVALQSLIKPDHGLIVGITHLYFKPDADHIRLLQIALCVGHLKKALQYMKEEKQGMQFSVILAGDFNSTPPFGVLQFMREGSIDENHADWSSCVEEEITGLSIKHPFRMESGCGTPKYTNYTIGFQDCLDYIFYQKDELAVTHVVPFPPEDDLKKYKAIPNIIFPSDHLASICDMKWIEK